MCRLFSLTAALSELNEQFQIERVKIEYKGRMHHVPRETISVVVTEGASKCLDSCIWGIFPFWAKDSINAESETMHAHPAYRSHFHKNRCVIPCDGFYGWKESGKAKLPVRFSVRDRSLFALAGIYDVWKNPRGAEYRTCTMLTTRPNRVVADYQDRMPAILEGEALDMWLNPEMGDTDALTDCLRPFHPDRMFAKVESGKFLRKD